MRRKLNPLTEVPEEGSVSSEYFFRMMSPRASVLAKNYLDDETNLLESTIDKLDDPKEYNLIAVAGGQLGMLKTGLEKNKSYTCIEPLANLYLGKQIQYLVKKIQNVHIVKKRFADTIRKDLPDGKNLFVFMFNILAYIKNPIREINDLIRPGDVLFISTWSATPKAKEIRAKYFDYLNSFEKKVIIDPENTIGVCDLRAFPFERLRYSEEHRFIRTEVVEILEIKLSK